MKSDYYERLETRAERSHELAERHEKASEGRFKAFHDNLQMIPMGQPILVGHHSERGHRAHLKRIDNHMAKAVEHDAKAKHFEGRAARAEAQLEGRGPIMADDPEAVVKLKAKIAEAENDQERMKQVNAVIRRHRKAGADAQVAALVALGFSEGTARKSLEPDFCGRIGIPSYALQNNNANIRRMKERLKSLEALETREDREYMRGEVRVVESATDNRLQFYFPGKPDEAMRSTLKSHGFRWSPRQGCWQRNLATTSTWIVARLLPAT